MRFDEDYQAVYVNKVDKVTNKVINEPGYDDNFEAM